MSFSTVIINTLLLLALAVPGYLLTKLKMADGSAVRTLSNLLLYVCMPFMVLKSFLTLRYEEALMVNILYSLLFSVLGTIAIMAVTLVVFRRKDVAGQKIYQLATMFSNCGFFGLPFLAAVFPDNGYVILYASMYIVVFNLLTWTLGVYMLTGDKKYVSVKKALVNPALIFSVIGFVLFVLKVSVPEAVITFSDFWSTMTSPVAMTVTGMRLAEMPLKALFSDWRAFVVSALRLLAAPALTWGILMIFGVSDADLFNAMVISAAMPVAATTVVFAEMFTDDSSAAVTTMLLSSVLCVVSIPIVAMIMLI